MRLFRFSTCTVAALAVLGLAAGAPALAAPTPGGRVVADISLSASWLAPDYTLVSQKTDSHFYAPVDFADGVTAGPAFMLGALQVSASPIPTISSTMNGVATPVGGASGDIFLTSIYSFQIFGPTDTVVGRVDALGQIGLASFTSSDASTVSALFRLSEANGAVLADAFISTAVLGNSTTGQRYVDNPFQQFVVADDFLFKTNTVYDVRLQTRIHAVAYGLGQTSIFAAVDPTITVDGPYSFQFSDGYGGGIVRGGGGTVPEPSTWALLIAGFGGAGAMIRRRRFVAVPA